MTTTMTTTTYNTRTLAACAKRLRHLEATLTPMPEWTIVWRWREGYRLQLAGEHHEPGGCQWMDGSTDPYGHDRTAEVEQALAKGTADQEAYDCLEALLETAPQEFDKASLIHLSCTTEPGRGARIGAQAFIALCQQAMRRNPAAKQYLQAAH